MTIDLYFLRHAIAVERGEGDFAEEERPLTDKGRAKMIVGIGGLRQLEFKFDTLLSSPFTRAVQTAELVREYLPYEGALEIEENLAPDGSLKSFLEKLGERKGKSFLLVGHEPNLSSWIQSLLGFGRKGGLLLKKGGLCRLHLEQASESASSELIYLLQPKHLRAMGRRD